MVEKNSFKSNFLYLYNKELDKKDNLKLNILFDRIKNGIENFSNICAQLKGFFKMKGKQHVKSNYKRKELQNH